MTMGKIIYEPNKPINKQEQTDSVEERYNALSVRAQLPAKYIDKKALQIGLLAMCREFDPGYEKI